MGKTWKPADGICFASPSSRPVSRPLHQQDPQAENDPSVDSNFLPADSSPAGLNPTFALNSHVDDLRFAKLSLRETNRRQVPDTDRLEPFLDRKIRPGEPKYQSPPRFQMTPELFGKAHDSLSEFGAGHQSSCWSHELYRGPCQEKVQVFYCKNLDQSERVARLFLDEPVLGFDLEWPVLPYKPKLAKRRVALIQLSSESRIALFHLALHFGNSPQDLISPTLKSILEDPDVLKTGASISQDCTRLRESLEVNVKATFELSHLHKLVKYSQTAPGLLNRKTVTLSSMCQEAFGLPLYKDQDVRTADWDKALNMDKARYAAADAYAGHRLFLALNQRRLEMDPVQPLPAYAEHKMPIEYVQTVKQDEDEMTSAAEGEQDNPEAQDAQLEGFPDSTEASEDEVDFQDAFEPSREEAAHRKPGKPLLQVLPPEIKLATEWSDVYFQNLRILRGGGKQEAQLARRRSASTQPRGNVVERRRIRDRAGPKPSHLRAYHLWHHQSLSIINIANILRSPPLQATTVSQYIADSIAVDRNLPFDETRLDDVVLHLPDHLRKYQWLRDIIIARISTEDKAKPRS